MGLRRDSAGFTLVELVVVVAVVAVLVAIAIPNFLNFRMKAKSAEAKSNLGAIRNSEIAYFAEWNYYITGQTWTPLHGATHSIKITWDSTSRFSLIGFEPEGGVYFEYRIEPTGSPTASTFTCRARSDLDDDGDWAEYYLGITAYEVLRTGDLF